MRKLILAALAIAVVASGAFAAFAGAGAGVKAPKDCHKPQNRPHRIVLACADFSLYINTIHWDVWKSGKAKGKGVLQQNDCNPNCASGTFHQFPAKIRLDDPKPTNCGGQKVNMFRHAHLKFPDGQPQNADALAKNKLFCD